MRVIERDQTRILLRGVPRDGRGFELALIVGGLFIGTGALLLPGSPAEPFVFRGLLGLLLVAGVALIISVLALVTHRESLELQRITGRGRYRKWSILFGTRLTFDFDLECVYRVTLEYRTEPQPAISPRERRHIETWQAKLLIKDPKRIFILSEENTDKGDQTAGIAEATAGFLGVDVITLA